MTDLMRLTHLFAHIKQHGHLRKPSSCRMGGIWSSDIYDYGPYMAQLCDDGSTQAVINGAFQAWSTYGRDVEYGRGSDANGLLVMYMTVMELDPEAVF